MTDTYTTKQGQAWDQIAKEALGSEKYMKELMTANPLYRHTVFFSAGTQINVPELDLPDNLPETLPPWKK